MVRICQPQISGILSTYRVSGYHNAKLPHGSINSDRVCLLKDMELSLNGLTSSLKLPTQSWFFFLLKGMALKLCRWFIMSWTCRWHCLSPEIDQLNQVLWYHIGAISLWNKIAPFISSILLLFFLFPFIILSFANSTMQNYWISTVCQLLGKAP